MSADWRKLSRSAGLRLVDDTIEVTFKDKRRQVVHVEENDEAEAFRLWSVVANRKDLSVLEAPSIDAWRRNRLTEFVGFSVDARGRMVGETYVPMGRLTADEWAFFVLNLARSADRFEYLITGQDEA